MKKYLCLLSVILFLCSSLFAAQEEWITLSNSNSSYAVGVNVVSSNENLIEIEYQLNGFYKKPVEINGEKFSKIILPDESIFLEEGLPELPRINRSIIIPAKVKMVAKAVNYEIEEFKNIKIIPSKGNLLRSVNPEDVPYTFDNFYSTDNWFPQEIVTTYDPYILRDARGMVVEVHPFQYNPAQKILRVYKKIRVKVENVGLDNINILDVDLSDKLTADREFLTIYNRRFINFDKERYDPIPEVGNMLIITYDAFHDEVLPLYEWKLQKGIPTELVDVGTIGNNYIAIKNYIQQKYDNEGVTYILLVGDAEQIQPYDDDKDPKYTQLAGYDSYPDAFIGRLSAQSIPHVETQVERFITYERDPLIGGDWYHKGTGVASAQGSGIGWNDWADYVMMGIIRDSLLAYTYSDVDQIYDPGASAAQVTAAINAGRSITNYCGHGLPTSWSTTGFSNSAVNALVNDNMLPFIISVACNNGQFPGMTCFGEAWLRATNNTTGEPTGAIGFYGSTIGQPWEPPMPAEYEANMLLVHEEKNTYGGLCFNGSMFMMDECPIPGPDVFEHWTLFGDPSLQVRTNTPEEMTVSHSPIIPLGSTTYDVEVVGVEGALIGLYMDDTLYGYGYTDETGNVTITLLEELLNPGEMTLTVTAYNKIPYITTIDAIIPVQVTISPDTINVNESTEVTVTVLDSDGIEPEVGVNVWAMGLDYEIDSVATDTSGVAILTINYQFGPSLSIFGQRPDDSYLLFDELLYVIALDLADPDLEVTTDFGLTDGFAMNLPGIIHAYCSEDETTLWAKLNDNEYISTTEDTLEFIPDELGTVYAIISKSGYNLYQEEFPVIIAYGTVSGIVTNSETGGPVSDIEVKFYEQGADPTTDDPLFTDITNAYGLYEITEEQPVDYYDIYIDEWGFNPYEELNYFLGYGTNSHDIVIDPVETAVVHGRIYDENGAVGNTTIIYYRSDNGEQYTEVNVGISGRYSVSLPYFTYNVYVSAPEHVPFTGSIPVDCDLTVDYSLGLAALFCNFENNDGDFSPTPPTNAWEWGEPTAGGINAYSGVNVWATNLDGHYVDNVDWYLNSPEFTVPDSGILYFYHYHNFEGSKGEKTFYDGGNVKISTNGGASFNLITPEGGYDGTISALGQLGFGSSIDEWELVEFDLSNYENDDVILRWHFASDYSQHQYYGWYIDDVLVGDPNSSEQFIHPHVSVSNTPITYKLELYQNYPNPVNPDIVGTNISFSLPKNTNNIELKIYNIKGQLVKNFELRTLNSELNNVVWDGSDKNGKRVASGLYFYKISAGNETIVKKMLLMK
ncbi:MAG: C25 family cysteine peptidase [Candidatus Cloacimonadota bacterium]|nr:C25 family cysteine peptidase [Candidatus Cloacimonadota bacterium]